MKKLICPKCQNEGIKKGALGASFGQVQMLPENKRGPSSSVSANYCSECGYILALYVDHPKNIT